MVYYSAKVKCKYENEETGKIQKVTELYLVYAESVTDVEIQITQKFANFGNGWKLDSVVETKILEVLNPNGDVIRA